MNGYALRECAGSALGMMCGCEVSLRELAASWNAEPCVPLNLNTTNIVYVRRQNIDNVNRF